MDQDPGSLLDVQDDGGDGNVCTYTPLVHNDVWCIVNNKSILDLFNSVEANNTTKSGGDSEAMSVVIPTFENNTEELETKKKVSFAPDLQDESATTFKEDEVHQWLSTVLN